MARKSFVRRHRKGLSIASFVFAGLPAWVQMIWALFSSEPLVPWLWSHKATLPFFLPSVSPLWALWITAPIGTIFLILIWRQERDGAKTQSVGSRQVVGLEVDAPAFEVGALAVSNLQNLTEVGKDMEGTAAWSLDCEIRIHNLHATQGIGDVTMRIISLNPSMRASPSHKPRTQDTTLRRVRFSFTDSSPGKALSGDQTGHVRIFNAVRHIMFAQEGKTVVRVNFFGSWPDNLGTEFAPEEEHALTVEVTGSGVKRHEAKFRLLFSSDLKQPVLRIVPIDLPPLTASRLAAIEKLVDETVHLIRNDKIQFTLYALQKAGAGNLQSEPEFLVARDAIIQRNHVDPIKNLDLPHGVTWLSIIRFANEKEINLYSPVAVYDCVQTYFTQG